VYLRSQQLTSNGHQSQLDQLVTTLKNTEPHYVRCIKPNTTKAAHSFDSDMVAAQLRYAGSWRQTSG
jgi:myosin heavy subunit